MKNILYHYNRFILRNPVLYYFALFAETLIIIFFLAKIVFRFENVTLLLGLLLSLIITVNSIMYFGGYKEIKRKFSIDNRERGNAENM